MPATPLPQRRCCTTTSSTASTLGTNAQEISISWCRNVYAGLVVVVDHGQEWARRAGCWPPWTWAVPGVEQGL
ncbi:hypothetical protein ON010_g13524 [Phytophthora cinnamomi]|nr:hypothetical protein ON010_g13524 [Phytophthora cinnamomi]